MILTREYSRATRAVAAGGTNMSSSRSRLHQGVVICLLIGAAIGGFFGLALLVAAVSGESFASSILLGGSGVLLLLLSIFIFVFVNLHGKSAKNGQGNQEN
jgi:hypothetical protein